MSLVENLALKALAAEEADREDEKRDPRWMTLALDVVRSSPLAGWFPVTWTVLDHNLPEARPLGHPEWVVVTADEDEEVPDPPVRFAVSRGGLPVAPLWSVTIVHPKASAATGWGVGETTMRTPADLGRWLKEHRP